MGVALVSRGQPGQQEDKVLKDLQEVLDRADLLVHRVRKELKELPAIQAQMALLEPLVRKDRAGHKDLLDRQAILDRLEALELPGHHPQ